MDVSAEQIEEIEELLRQMENLDPADLPGPAAKLVDILSELLETEPES